jgi:hypothetical protein
MKSTRMKSEDRQDQLNMMLMFKGALTQRQSYLSTAPLVVIGSQMLEGQGLPQMSPNMQGQQFSGIHQSVTQYSNVIEYPNFTGHRVHKQIT